MSQLVFCFFLESAAAKNKQSRSAGARADCERCALCLATGFALSLVVDFIPCPVETCPRRRPFQRRGGDLRHLASRKRLNDISRKRKSHIKVVCGLLQQTSAAPAGAGKNKSTATRLPPLCSRFHFSPVDSLISASGGGETAFAVWSPPLIAVDRCLPPDGRSQSEGRAVGNQLLETRRGVTPAAVTQSSP